MSFANPTYLWAFLGLLVPIAIHLWSNKEGKVIKVGSIKFLENSESSQSKSIKLNEYLLLFLRLLLLSLLVLILAEPQIHQNSKKSSLTYLIEPSLLKNNMVKSVIDNVNYYVSRSINNPQIVLEKLSGSYINILNNLSNPLHPNSFYEEKKTGEYHIVSGNLCNILSGSGGVFNNNSASGKIKKIIVPLPFSFSNNSGNAIPTILFGHNYNLIFSTKIYLKNGV